MLSVRLMIDCQRTGEIPLKNIVTHIIPGYYSHSPGVRARLKNSKALLNRSVCLDCSAKRSLFASIAFSGFSFFVFLKQISIVARVFSNCQERFCRGPGKVTRTNKLISHSNIQIHSSHRVRLSRKLSGQQKQICHLFLFVFANTSINLL